MVREFFYAVSYGAGMNLHLKKLSGDNNHHVIEGMFKALGRALADAVSEDPAGEGRALHQGKPVTGLPMQPRSGAGVRPDIHYYTRRKRHAALSGD